jgi:predicted dehydrogenase
MREGTIGIGVISFAHGHVRTYCSEWVNMPDVKLVAAWDDDTARGQEAASSYGMDFVSDLDDLLSNPAIDFIAIASETARHTDHTLAAIRAGKDVLLQKPMALSLADCDRIIDAVAKFGTYFSMAFQMRFDPCNIRIRQLVQDGALGNIINLRRRHSIPVLFSPDFLNAWHVKPDMNMGMWMDDATHAADFIYWVLGRPVSVMAEVEAILIDTSITPDDTGVAIYKYADRRLAVLTNSSIHWMGENTCEVFGDKGVLVQNHDDGVSMRALPPDPIFLKLFLEAEAERGWQDQEIPLPPGHGSRIAAVAHGALRDYRAGVAQCPAAEGKVSIEMVLAAYKSAAEGRRINLDDL